jgi:hypothetical protein
VFVIIQPCHVVVWESCVCEGFQDSHSKPLFSAMHCFQVYLPITLEKYS